MGLEWQCYRLQKGEYLDLAAHCHTQRVEDLVSACRAFPRLEKQANVMPNTRLTRPLTHVNEKKRFEATV